MTPGADAIVVGGGPAGAMAASALARRGASVLVLDKKRFPRDKPCGGGIRYSVFRRFPDLAAPLRSGVAIHEVHKVLMDSPCGVTVTVKYEAPMYITLRRTEFDAALLERARAHGARVIEGARVTGLEDESGTPYGTRNAVATAPGPSAGERASGALTVRCVDGRAFRARLVIGADGVNSVVAREAGLTRGFPDEVVAIDTMEETPLAELAPTDSDTMYVAYGHKGWPGYGYVFPKTAHVDAGVGFLIPFFKRELHGKPYEQHLRFLEEAARKGWVRGRSNAANFKAYRLPLGGPLARTYADGVLVAGDAGSFVNSYTGEGIYYAMVTGQLAGETAARALEASDVSAARLAEYQVAWQREIGEELADSFRIGRRLFFHPWLVNFIIRAAAVDPRLAHLFAAVALGEESYRRRKPAMAARLLLALARPRRRR